MEHLRMWLFGIILLALTFIGPAVLPDANRAEAARGGQEKVVICHRSEDNEHRVTHKTLRVAAPAAKAHLKHGDAEGACPVA